MDAGNGKRGTGALPLLFAGLLLTTTAAVLLAVPFFDCPACDGRGVILDRRREDMTNIFDCILCRQDGRVRTWTRLRADPSSEAHRGRLRGFTRSTGN